jgi:Transposase IS116/IS110/IS902 family
MALPGVGKPTAMTLLAEIGAIGRFPTARKLCAFTGLTPQVPNADRTLRHGHITKQGSPWGRWILQEAAQSAKKSPLLADTDGQLARRRGPNIATVAIARRLLARSFHILTQLEAAPAPGNSRPGALASLHEPVTRPPVLTEQPGSGLHRHATPPSGPEWVHASPLRDLVRAFSSQDPVPVLAGVKVLPSPGRSTLTSAAAGGPSRYEKPAKPCLRAVVCPWFRGVGKLDFFMRRWWVGGSRTRSG